MDLAHALDTDVGHPEIAYRKACGAIGEVYFIPQQHRQIVIVEHKLEATIDAALEVQQPFIELVGRSAHQIEAG